jgi:2-polyprenyl-3-methyl-5-hydroxy-6-metoxy-1,4-benzoquinol methylase
MTQEEEMDAIALPDDRYARVLTHLGRVNAVTLAMRPTLCFVGEVARGANGPVKILDVGFGDGGMLRAIAAWGARAGVGLELVGIDLNPRSETVARAETPAEMPITYRTGDYRDLTGRGWDIIISSLVTHHMADDERDKFLHFMERESARGWFVNDLHRHRLPYMGYPLLATLLGVDGIVRRDGQLSIARSFRVAEWQAMLASAGIASARIDRWFPFRLCVARLKATQ